MARPKLLGIDYASQAAPVRDAWLRQADEGTKQEQKLAKAKLKSLDTFEFCARADPLRAGQPVAKDRWPATLADDYGPDIPNLFRFELADRWRGYYALVGEPGGAGVWVLYLWDHATYSKASGYSRK